MKCTLTRCLDAYCETWMEMHHSATALGTHIKVLYYFFIVGIFNLLVALWTSICKSNYISPPHEKSAVALISKTELRCRTVHLLNISTLTAKAHRDNSMAGDSQTNFIVAWL